ncbi:MAG: NADPH:quinone oxidoreductase family protein [Actinomycetota bacterium]|nr:NADPH:quinone oxidoreductase family protein [Actinomycetota bacterium]
MRAVLCKEWGDPSTLALEEVESPSPIAGEVRVAVRAAGVNFADNLIISGQYQFKPSFPFSPGFEVSGVVAEVGEDVNELAPGDRVMAALPHGGYAEKVVVPAANVLPIPEGVNFPDAAAFPLAYATAHLALIHRARLSANEVLLVHGGAGNVGRAAIEVGKRLGATVIATAGGPEHLRIASEHGADHTIDYEREDIRDRVEESTAERGADVILDPGGGDAFDASLRCVAWEGRIIVIGFASGRIPEAPAWRVLLKNCAVMGMDWAATSGETPKWSEPPPPKRSDGMRKERSTPAPRRPSRWRRQPTPWKQSPPSTSTVEPGFSLRTSSTRALMRGNPTVLRNTGPPFSQKNSSWVSS